MFYSRIIFLLAIYITSKSYLQVEAISASLFGGLKNTKGSGTPSRGLLFRQREILNAVTGTVLDWEVDPQRRANSTITFTFSTRIENVNDIGTTTIILLGLSRTGQVDRSDVAAVTVNSGQGSQLVDMHGVDNATIVPDAQQNWSLVSSQRNASHVSITVSRILNTCDEQDVVIDSDLLRILWGYSQPSSTSGSGSLTFTPEGSVRAYLLDPVIPSPAESSTSVQTWRVARTFQLPARRTSYWCTFHRGLPLTRKHHIVGFAPYFRDATSEQFVHHKSVYRCLAPTDVDPSAFFDRFVGHPGEECYLEEDPQLPTVFCKEVMMSWAVGGKPFYFPDDIGLALGESRNEYFMLETHYNNPERRPDVVVENGIDFLYTPDLRPDDGSIVFVSHGILGLFQVPPRQSRFTVAGHCSSECTRLMVPYLGMQIEAAILHSHLTGRKITLRQFRGDKELPWIQSEGNYDFNYQEMRLLSPPATILPGDHLMVECELDTSERNATTLSGFSTAQEMCTAFLVLNKRLPYTFCSSEYPIERTLARYGVTNMTWSLEGQDQERVVNAANNPKYVGLPLPNVIDQCVGPWTPQKVRELEWEQLYGDQESTCPPMQDVLQLAHSLQYLEDVSKGFIPTGIIVDNLKTTTRSIRTATIPGLRSVKYPRGSAIYNPPPTCTAP